VGIIICLLQNLFEGTDKVNRHHQKNIHLSTEGLTHV